MWQLVHSFWVWGGETAASAMVCASSWSLNILTLLDMCVPGEKQTIHFHSLSQGNGVGYLRLLTALDIVICLGIGTWHNVEHSVSSLGFFSTQKIQQGRNSLSPGVNLELLAVLLTMWKKTQRDKLLKTSWKPCMQLCQRPSYTSTFFFKLRHNWHIINYTYLTLNTSITPLFSQLFFHNFFSSTKFPLSSPPQETTATFCHYILVKNFI